MIKVVGISFGEEKKIYYFDPRNYDLKRNVTVIVDTERGLQFGKVELPTFEIDEQKIKRPLKKVLRISSKNDFVQHRKNIKDSKEALKKCQKIVEDKKLNMKIIDSSYNFDRTQLLFRFLSDNRVDFRDLAKELANCYKTRIELRQLGVRDKAKEIGGYGVCGQELCCSRFNCEFASVSISMAKNQNLSLNPNKINGACGRLLCCLKYENESYKESRKDVPPIDELIETKYGKGKVVSADILNRKYKVDIPNVGIVEINIDGN